MAAVLLLIPVAAWALLAVLFVRNNRVYEYQMSLLDEASKAAVRDIYAGRDWQRNFDALDRVSYDRMWLMFWKPLDSFYEGILPWREEVSQ